MVDIAGLMDLATADLPLALRLGRRQLEDDERALFCVVNAQCPTCLRMPGRPCVRQSPYLADVLVLDEPHHDRWTPAVERKWRRETSKRKAA